MTDDKLNEKLRAAFDDVRADSAVKARIRKGLTGDTMERKNITVNDTDENYGKKTATGKAQVKRGGRIAAAAIAGVLAVGGGMLMLKNNFNRVESSEGCYVSGEEVNSSEEDKITTDEGSSNTDTISDMVSISENFSGEFDPNGYTLYDKFGNNANIWRLSNGNFLVKQTVGDGAEYYDYNGMEHHFFIYDPKTNSVVGSEIVSEFFRITVYKNCIGLWNFDYGEPNECGAATTTDMSGTLYDFDLQPVKENINIHIEDSTLSNSPLVAPDLSVYIAGVSYRNTDNGQKSTLTVYGEDSGAVFSSEEEDGITCCDIAENGGYFYYGTCKYNEDDSTSYSVHTVPREDGYIESEHTDGESTPLYFDVGKYLYTVTHDDDGKTVVRKADISGNEELVFTQPEDGIVFNTRTSPEHCYVTDDGKYLFSSEEHGMDNTLLEDIGMNCRICIYDIENDFKPVYDETLSEIGTTFEREGCNVFYDEASGDVCISGFTYLMMSPSGRSGKALCFNVNTDDYTNFGISGNASATDESSLVTETIVD